jgi:hypothetical protein
MRKLQSFILILSLAITAGVAGLAAANADNKKTKKRTAKAPVGAAWEVASMLNGTYRGEGEAAGLRLDISSAQNSLPSSQLFNLFTTLTGKHGRRNFNERGIVQLEAHVDQVIVSVVPHFDPSVSLLSDSVTEFSPTEVQAACHLFLIPLDQGYAGRTQGSGTCVRAIGGAVGDWQVQILPGVIRFSKPDSQEALVFRKTGRG